MYKHWVNHLADLDTLPIVLLVCLHKNVTNRVVGCAASLLSSVSGSEAEFTLTQKPRSGPAHTDSHESRDEMKWKHNGFKLDEKGELINVNKAVCWIWKYRVSTTFIITPDAVRLSEVIRTRTILGGITSCLFDLLKSLWGTHINTGKKVCAYSVHLLHTIRDMQSQDTTIQIHDPILITKYMWLTLCVRRATEVSSHTNTLIHIHIHNPGGNGA